LSIKKKFNFNVFSHNKNQNETGDNGLPKDINKLTQVSIKQKIDEINSDFYREIIKEKTKIEAECRKELMEVTHNIYESKLEKTQIQNIGIELYNEMSEAKQEYMVNIFIY
jgi:hypothetical protein